MLNKKMKEESFGAIPIIKTKDSYLFLLIHHKMSHWSFPKGHSQDNELPKNTAKRELYEETGIKECNFIDDMIFEENYSFEENNKIYNKKVTYFICFVDAIQNKIPSDYRDEILSIRWVGYNEALKLLTFEGTKRLLKKVKQHINPK